MNIDLAKLEKFGDVAAEDDAVIDYFLETDEVAKVKEHRNFLVLGRKGAGKTAIVRYFTERDTGNAISKALNLRNYPWSVHAQRRDAGATEMETYVASWRYLIAVELASVVLGRVSPKDTEQGGALRKYLIDNYGGVDPSLSVIVRPDKLQISQAAIEPIVLGNKIGSVSLSRTDNGRGLGLELDALTNALLEEVLKLIGVNQLESIYLHFDELDRGLSRLDVYRIRFDDDGTVGDVDLIAFALHRQGPRVRGLPRHGLLPAGTRRSRHDRLARRRRHRSPDVMSSLGYEQAICVSQESASKSGGVNTVNPAGASRGSWWGSLRLPPPYVVTYATFASLRLAVRLSGEASRMGRAKRTPPSPGGYGPRWIRFVRVTVCEVFPTWCTSWPMIWATGTCRA